MWNRGQNDRKASRDGKHQGLLDMEDQHIYGLTATVAACISLYRSKSDGVPTLREVDMSPPYLTQKLSPVDSFSHSSGVFLGIQITLKGGPFPSRRWLTN